MISADTYKTIKASIESAPRNAYVAELHLQVLKYSDALGDVSGKEFCDAVGIGSAYGTEFLKMRKIAARLKAAGLDVSRI